jgi:hypothetical protein
MQTEQASPNVILTAQVPRATKTELERAAAAG